MKNINKLLCTLALPFMLVACGGNAEEEKEPVEENHIGYKVTFVTDENCSISWFDKNDTTLAPVKTDTAYSLDKTTGEETDSEGQVTFKIEFTQNYQMDGTLDVSGEEDVDYGSVKTPRDTGLDGVYKITKIAKDLTVTIKSKVAEKEEGYKVTFVVNNGQTEVYDGQDYEKTPTLVTWTETINPDTGKKTKDSDFAQVNFRVVPSTGYAIPTESDITITGTYKNLKSQAKDGYSDVWRITKIGSDLTVTIDCPSI